MYLTTSSDPNLVTSLLETVKNDVQTLASKIHVGELILFVAAAALGLILGIFGYKLIKLWMSVTAGFIGYWGGAALFEYLTMKFEVLEKLPDFVAYILGGLFAIAFLYLGWRKFSYVMFTVFVLLGMLIVEDVSGVLISAMYLAGGILLGLLSVLAARISFAALSSLAGTLSLFYFTCEAFPILAENQWVNFLENRNANYVVLGTAVVFFVIQLLINKRKKRRHRA